ncbi:purine-nucleoside phosphorylase [Pelosinus sp. sgz500959]|uniref:purine-nucleoside phosphorylase n=1 Tax=Pelosinus sp. sgz500959 TaxID=3242472 RepID=UPI003672E1B9
MSIHINAEQGDIASTVLMPGDPLRAKFIAEKFLQKAVCYNEVRGMYGYTGFYKGKRISVQASGMGVPSISIYAHELITSYNVKNIIRIGTCGSLQENVKIKDVIMAMSASHDSNINLQRFEGMTYAPTASFQLLEKAYHTAQKLGIEVKVGNIFTTDTFYHDNPTDWKRWSDFGVLAVEMETVGLYTLAAKHGINALTILTVSDSLVTGEATTADERQTTFTQMMNIALEMSE